MLLNKTCAPDGAATDVSDEITTTIFSHFSSTCRRYTDVMAFKKQLQCHMFAGTSETASQLTPLIIELHTAALKLQHIEVQRFEIILRVYIIFT